MSFYLKDPSSRVDYAVDWSGYLNGQVVAESGWTIAPGSGLQVDEASFGLQRAAATLVGGVVGQVYTVTNRVTLSDGRTDARSITIRVEGR